MTECCRHVKNLGWEDFLQKWFEGKTSSEIQEAHSAKKKNENLEREWTKTLMEEHFP